MGPPWHAIRRGVRLVWIVVSHLDTSSYSASQKQCVFQYGEFYGSFWLGMLCMMAFARSPATERAVCITCFIYMAFVSNATWYQQANFFEGNLSFVFFDLLQGAIFLLLAFVVPNQTAEVKPLAKPLLEGGA